MKYRPEENDASSRVYTGTVTRFDKGYGFIAFDKGGEERRVFVHWSDLLMPGYKTLEEGQTVDFELKHEAKGWKAVNVQVVR